MTFGLLIDGLAHTQLSVIILQSFVFEMPSIFSYFQAFSFCNNGHELHNWHSFSKIASN